VNIKNQRQIILKYLSGKANSNEVEWVEAWYKSFEREDSDAAAITAEEIEESKRLILSKILRNNKFQKTRLLFKYAAILLALGSFGLLVYNQHGEEKKDEIVSIRTNGRADTTFKLPDSSTIWLNRNSELSYNATTFNSKQRRVYLKKGEAYFEVKRDTTSRFSVISNNMSVNVLGTGFNVYKEEKLSQLEVMVSHGLVEVNLSDKRLSYLKRGEVITVNTGNGRFNKKHFDPDYAAAWRTDEIILNKASFQAISQIFFSLYKINLVSTDEISKKYTYTLTIDKKDDFKATLSVITSIHQNHFKQNGNTIIIY
jgi:transmembrane sensor